MRPAGEVRQALLDAALALTTAEQSPTLKEMACHAQVGFLVARRTVSNMRRARALEVVRTRKVDYRNRPVAEYSLPQQYELPGTHCQPLMNLIRSWAATPAA